MTMHRWLAAPFRNRNSYEWAVLRRWTLNIFGWLMLVNGVVIVVISTIAHEPALNRVLYALLAILTSGAAWEVARSWGPFSGREFIWRPPTTSDLPSEPVLVHVVFQSHSHATKTVRGVSFMEPYRVVVQDMDGELHMAQPEELSLPKIQADCKQSKNHVM